MPTPACGMGCVTVCFASLGGAGKRSVPGRGTTSAALCPFSSSWPLHGAVLGSCRRAAPRQSRPRAAQPLCASRIAVPVLSVVCSWC